MKTPFYLDLNQLIAEQERATRLEGRTRVEIVSMAQSAVARAVREGALVRPDACERCGGSETRIEGHHPDYHRPLDVRWLCIPCHAQADARRRLRDSRRAFNASHRSAV